MERMEEIIQAIEELDLRVAINTSNCPGIKERIKKLDLDRFILSNIDVLTSPDYFNELVEQIYEDNDDAFEFEGSTEFYKSERVTDILFAYYDTSLTMSVSIEKKDNSNRAIIVTYNTYTGKYSRLVYDFWENISLEENMDEIMSFMEVELESEIKKIRKFKQEHSLGLKRA